MGKAQARAKPNRKFSMLVSILRKHIAKKQLTKKKRQLLEILLSRAENMQENVKDLVESKSLAGCDTGLSVSLQVTADERQISFSLDNLSKEQVVERLSRGELYEEIMTLHRLALLPGTEYFTLNVSLPGESFDIIDRVYLYLDEAVNPFRQTEPLDLLDVLSLHIPYDKSRAIERGICWLEAKRRGRAV